MELRVSELPRCRWGGNCGRARARRYGRVQYGGQEGVRGWGGGWEERFYGDYHRAQGTGGGVPDNHTDLSRLRGYGEVALEDEPGGGHIGELFFLEIYIEVLFFGS